MSPAQYISGRRGMRNRAVEHNMAAFSELSFAVCWLGRLVLTGEEGVGTVAKHSIVV